MTRMIEVKTPGRLHCGLTSFGHSGRQYGGLGIMLADVGVTLQVVSAQSFRASGPLSERVEKFANVFAKHQGLAELPACRIEVLEAPPEHVGLGVGTQLGLAVTAGLAEWLQVAWRDAQLLSEMSGRGRRSAIGTYGFLQGGLIVDAGKLSNQVLGDLSERIAVPEGWRFVLIRPSSKRGDMAGEKETQAIGSLSAVPVEVTAELERLIHEEILPATHAANWQSFGSAIYRYGHLAGECFAEVQGGPFATTEIAALVDRVRELGFPGVGQSSWGPTVFAIAENLESAENLVDLLKQDDDYRDRYFAIAQPNNNGVKISNVSS